MMHQATVWVKALSAPALEQEGGDGQQYGGENVGAGDHLAAADGVEEGAEQ